MNTNWKKWENKSSIPNSNQPGIYFLSLTDQEISGQEFSLAKEIIYIGMTISDKGIQGRLYQFERAISRYRNVHGGGDRVRYWLDNNGSFMDEQAFFNNLFVSVKIFPVSKTRMTPEDWRQKGECVKHEYTSFADYLELHGHLPQFNDQKRSQKNNRMNIL